MGLQKGVSFFMLQDRIDAAEQSLFGLMGKILLGCLAGTTLQTDI
jgi:hypothetical protein